MADTPTTPATPATPPTTNTEGLVTVMPSAAYPLVKAAVARGIPTLRVTTITGLSLADVALERLLMDHTAVLERGDILVSVPDFDDALGGSDGYL